MIAKVVVPALGESIIEATVGRWLKQEGEAVAVGETILELETDKVNLEVGAEQAGILAHIERQEGANVQVGEVLGTIETAPDQPASAGLAEAKVQADSDSATPSDKETAKDRATPVAWRLAQEHGLDLAQLPGTEFDHRVTKNDVERYLAEHQEAPAPRAPVKVEKPDAKPTTPAEPAPTAGRAEERVRMSRRRQTIARRLVEAQHTAAMLTTFNEVDMSAVMALRSRRKETFQKRHEVGLSISAFFVKAAIGALKAFPQLNAEIDGDEIILKHYYDIGVAIGAPEGLVVPVLREADRLTFADISRAIQTFAEQAEQNTLSLEDLRGGTFTLTNGGVYGSLMSTPILNPPQVGILGMHRIEDRPIAVKGEVVIRPMMYVALSYDHRIVDGREAVQFLVRLKELVEDPETLLLEG